MLSRLMSYSTTFFRAASAKRTGLFKSQEKAVLQEIDFNLPEDMFNQQAFAALKKHGGFILTNIDEGFSEKVNKFFTQYDAFRKIPVSEQKQFYGDPSSATGYFSDGSYIFGSKVGPRYFIDHDAEGNVLHPVCPALQAADAQLLPYTKHIIAKTITAMQSGLEGLQH
jgi:hypothetical protein